MSVMRLNQDSTKETFENIINIRSKDKVLLVGKSDDLSNYLSEFCGTVKVFKKFSDLNKSILKSETFDKVILFDNDSMIIDSNLISKCLQLNSGLFAYLFKDESLKNMVNDLIEENIYQANIWAFETNLGNVLLTDAKLLKE